MAIQGRPIEEALVLEGQVPQARRRLSAAEVVQELRRGIMTGERWQSALLKAIGRWPLAYEDIGGVRYQYLLLNEAFDWVLLANRLLEEVDGLVPREEKGDLLFHSELSNDIQDDEFKALLGPEKYSAYLNYFYGVMVEESLLLAVEEEIRKERASRGLPESEDITNLAFRRIYGEEQQVMVQSFFQETGRMFTGSMTFLELKEFTYWLFKVRVNSGESSRVASDTRKGMARLQNMHESPYG